MSYKEKATELEWLRYFYRNADFGPADGDVRFYLAKDFKHLECKELPDGYYDDGREEGEE